MTTTVWTDLPDRAARSPNPPSVECRTQGDGPLTTTRPDAVTHSATFDASTDSGPKMATAPIELDMTHSDHTGSARDSTSASTFSITAHACAIPQW